jgi:FkbM family methyltransferase
MKIKNLRSFLKKIPVISYLGSKSLWFFRELRGRYLSIKYPDGTYLSCNDVDVFCDFFNRSFWWYDGYKANLELDQKVIRAILEEAEGDVFIDIGAHFGFFSAFLSKELSNKHNEVLLIAMEPDISNFECLNMTMQKCQYPLVQFAAMNYAISENNGSQKMFKSEQPCIHSYEEPGAKLHSEINAISLDSLIEEHVGSRKVAFIKIDIDGAEPLFFRGGQGVLKSHKPIVFIEFAPTYLAAFGENVQEYFSDLCNQYHVYWVSYQLNQIREVSVLDYEYILKVVGNTVTDLVLSSRPLSICNVLNKSYKEVPN